MTAMKLKTEKLLTVVVLLLSSGFGYCDAEDCDGISFYASLRFGFFGDLTYYTLRNVDDGTRLLFGEGSGSGSELVLEECLEQACYEFEIEDDCGDSTGAIQSYFINLDGEQIYYSDGPFGWGEKVSFCAGGCDDYKFSLSLLTDYYPEDTSWKLRKSTGRGGGFPQVISGDDYRNIGGYYYYQQSTNIYVEQCIDPGCYHFQIFDNFGDGICPNSGCGNYGISVDEQQIYSSNGQYGSGEYVNFCVGSSCIDSPFTIADVGKDCADVVNDPSLCDITGVKSHCPNACGACADYACEDSTALMEFSSGQFTCAMLASQDPSDIDEKCKNGNRGLPSTCRSTCGNCVYP